MSNMTTVFDKEIRNAREITEFSVSDNMIKFLEE